MLSKIGEIRRDDLCLDYGGGSKNLRKLEEIVFRKCHGQQGNQNWWMNNDGSLNHDSGFCVELSEEAVDQIYMAECDKNNARQKWIWDLYNNNKIHIN